jgi:hypothetical protein
VLTHCYLLVKTFCLPRRLPVQTPVG